MVRRRHRQRALLCNPLDRFVQQLAAVHVIHCRTVAVCHTRFPGRPASSPPLRLVIAQCTIKVACWGCWKIMAACIPVPCKSAAPLPRSRPRLGATGVGTCTALPTGSGSRCLSSGSALPRLPTGAPLARGAGGPPPAGLLRLLASDLNAPPGRLVTG